MSAEKGGALVRSPPTIVDTYGTHVGANTGWDEHSPPRIPTLKTQQSQKNASVTKLPSGGYKDSKSKSTTTVRSTTDTDTSTKSPELSEDELNTQTENVNCACGGWSKARQMEYDLRQLQTTHEIILNGLHHQLDDMKQKNRDLTFQLLMGPFANSVKVEAPLSPESDVTPPKETVKADFKDERRNTYEEAKVEKENTKSKDGSGDHNAAERKHATNQRKTEKVRSNDPRQPKSLDLELLEEESESLRKQLFEEKARNKYLQNLAEDLKRQIRDETGAWRPPPPPSSQKYNYNTPQSRINTSSDYGQTPNIFRLPHIDYNNDQKLNSIQEQIEQRELQKLQTQNSKKRKEGSKHSERNGRLVTTTSLPAISKSGDDYLMIQQHQKGNKIEKSDYYIQNEHSSNKDQHKSGAKNHSQSSENIYFPTREVTRSVSYEQQKEKYKQYGIDHYYDKRSYRSGSKSVHEVPNRYQENDHPSVEDLRIREPPRRSEIQSSGVQEQRRAQSPLKQRLYSEENPKSRNASRRKSMNEVNTFHSSDRTDIYETSLKSNGDFSQLHLNQRISYENDEQKHGRKNSDIHERISFGSSSQNNMSGEPVVNPTSSLAGTLPQSSGKGKHRGKNSKRGGKRNRKESQGTKEVNE